MSPKAESKSPKKTSAKPGKTGLGKKSPAAARSTAKGSLKVASGKAKVTSKIRVVRSKPEKPATAAKERVAHVETRAPKMGRKLAHTFSEVMEKVLKTLDDRKVENLRILKVTDLVGYTDFLIIGTGMNTPHVQSMADSVAQLLKVPGIRGARIEGFQDAAWILVDGGDFVVHLFQPDARKYYSLEELWEDAPSVAWP